MEETMSSAAAHEVKSSDVIFRVDQIDKDIVVLEEKFDKVEKDQTEITEPNPNNSESDQNISKTSTTKNSDGKKSMLSVE